MVAFNLIGFGFDAWSQFWKRNQTMFYLLAKQPFIAKALFVNPEVWPMNLIRSPRREFAPQHIVKWRYIIPRRVGPKITVYTPLQLPLSGRVRRMREWSLSLSRLVVTRFQTRPYILLVNTPEPDIAGRIDALMVSARVKVFDWSDDYEQFADGTDARDRVAKAVHYYLARSDIVLTINERLTWRATQVNSESFTIPNATNMFTFADSKRKQDVPRALRHLHPPIIGYMGWLNAARLDLDLIEYLARARPQWSFVFVGPQSHEGPLGAVIAELPNVRIVPPVEYRRLASVLEQFDVCILPNRVDPYTAGNDPIKLYDYLASGKPVVSTRTAGTERIADVLYLADTKEQFLSYLDGLVSGDDGISRNRRIELARANSWQTRFQLVLSILRHRLTGE